MFLVDGERMMSSTIGKGLAAASSAVLLAACYSPWNVSELIWVWSFPLLWVLWRDAPVRGWRGWGSSFLYGYGCGYLFFVINLFWIRTVTWPGAFLLPLYLALYFGLWASLAHGVAHPRGHYLSSWGNIGRAIFLALAWVAGEWLRGVLFTGFGWNGLGVALQDHLLLIQGADIVGVTGLSAIPLFVGVLVWQMGHRLWAEWKLGQWRVHLDFYALVLFLMALFFYGWDRVEKYRQPEGFPLRVLLVQENIPQEEKWDPVHAQKIYQLYREKTLLYLEQGDFDLVIWPESALPRPLYSNRETFSYVVDIASRGNFAFVLGTEEMEDTLFYNSLALLQNRGAQIDLYRKIHLVPFGEFLPFREVFPPLQWLVGDLIPGDFSRGKLAEPLWVNELDYGIIPLICFEDTVGRLSRRFVRPGRAQIMVNITNDGWFERTAASRQHLHNALFRAIELRLPLLRATNTGVSAIVDARGSLRHPEDGHWRYLRDPDTGDTFISGALPDTVLVPLAQLTWYARYGDFFAIGALLVTVLGALATGIKRALAFTCGKDSARSNDTSVS